MTDLTPEKIAALKTAHGQITKISQDGEFVVIRQPTPQEYRCCMDKRSEGGPQEARALEDLGRTVTVFPDGPELIAVFQRRPGLAYMAGDKALVSCGIGKVEAEKL